MVFAASAVEAAIRVFVPGVVAFLSDVPLIRFLIPTGRNCFLFGACLLAVERTALYANTVIVQCAVISLTIITAAWALLGKLLTASDAGIFVILILVHGVTYPRWFNTSSNLSGVPPAGIRSSGGRTAENGPRTISSSR